MNPTLSSLELERILQMARAASLERSTPMPSLIARAERNGRLPLSFAQQRVWFLEQLSDLGGTYHMGTHLRLRGALDRAALVRALDRIVARHEALRTTFAQVDGVPEQRIAPPDTGFHLVEHDLDGAANAEAELGRLMTEDADAPFDLKRGPLIRGCLVRLAADDHVLLVTMHHIVSDAWSMGVFTHELSALYGAFRRGEPDPLPALELQYADYAVWQRRWMDGEVLQQQADYWTRTLSGAPELLELPTDHPRPSRMDHAGATFGLELDEALAAGLKALSRRHGTTLFMTLLAGWAVVLGRLSGQDDVVVGSPMAGRGRREVEGLIGFFVNTLALRVDLSGGPTVAELLARVRERVLDGQQHQDIPFEQVVELVDPARSLSHGPLFQVMFAWQNAPGGSVEIPGLAQAPLGPVGSAEQVTAKFDLSLGLSERDGRIVGRVEYATSLFERATVERWAGYLRRVLEEMVADESLRVERLELMPGSERALVLEEWSRAEAEHPGESFVHGLFEAQVERTLDAVAVTFEGEHLTYAELNRRANRLARHLARRGVGPDLPVGLCLEGGPEMVVALLAVLKAGGAYVPLDPEHPEDRLRYVLADSAPVVLLTQASLAEPFAAVEAPRIRIDADAADWAHEPETDPARGALTPENLAYVIYTSGSTGRPKGVRVEHGALAATMAAAGRAFGFGPADRVPSLASFAFDIWLFESLLPLLAGGSVRLFPRDRVLEVPRLVQDLAACTTLHAVPALMRRIVQEVRATPGGVLRGLRRAFVGGDAVAPDLLEEMRGAFPAAEIDVLYGPTEAAIICATHRLGSDPARRQMVGRPLGNAALYVLLPGGTVAPPGAPGELCLGGRSLARDYLERPGLTAERFVPDPFSALPGARLYRTGDRVRWLPSGELEFLGRTDRQVKLRGFRIEPGEIEARLAEHPAVREAVVLVREDTPGEKRLVAYVTGGEAAGAEDLRAHLAAWLPAYMVPAAYVRLEQLPLTPNGKVDRRALPAPEHAADTEPYEAPRTPVEEALAGIWAEVLKVERVGRHDHFFELGGHSLLAVQVISRVRQALQADVALGELFTRPVLADFARALETAARAEPAPIEPAPREGRLPLSFAQQRLWFIDRLEPGSTAYHIPSALRLHGPLDARVLERALGEVVRRHEALRTTFEEAEGVPFQMVHPAGAARLEQADLSRLAPAQREAEAGRRVREAAQRPFDLRRGPLLRTHLLRLGEEAHVLVLAMHHVVSDGWSMGVLFGELSALYGAFARGEASPLPELPVQYADYAVWQRAWLAGEVLEEQIAYWRERLAGAPPLLEMPLDRPRATGQGARAGSHRSILPHRVAEGLRVLSRAEGATLFMTLLAGWQALLGRWAAQDDVVVGTPIAGRTQHEVEGLIGFFVNMLPLRAELGGDPTWRELLVRVRGTALGAYAHQQLPFERLVEELVLERSLAHEPVFQVVFSLQRPGGEQRLSLGRVETEPFGAGAGVAKYDLELTVVEAQGELAAILSYREALFEAGTIARLAGHLETVLEAMSGDPARRLSELSLLRGSERAQVLEAWNSTAAELPRKCIHELFAEQAARTPEAVAVVFRDESVTYAELERRADRLAHSLRRRGVGPEVRVGVCLERGVEMVVAVLGILKAGGVYVPLDPAYPAERLAYMAADSGAAVLLVDPDLPDVLPSFAGERVRLEEERDAEPDSVEDEAPPASGLSLENAAYVIYTSGSTGRPKGVVVTHAGAANLLPGAVETLGATPGGRVLQAASMSFDASVLEVFVALLSGAELHVAEREVVLSPERLAALLREREIEAWMSSPALLDSLPDADFPALRTLCTGGERCPADTAARWSRGRRLMNLYGPTEATIYATAHACAPGAAEAPPIGRPVANARVYVLDAWGEPAPVGVPGELHVGGAGVARGYLGRAELTAEKFVPDAFGGRAGERLYRTGDRARWRADGELEFLGRVDAQVKIRGFRIEPGEVEAALLLHPGVREAVVVAREAPSGIAGDRRLVGYVVAASGEAVSPAALREHLTARLPEHMVPSAVVELESLPLTPSGKLDRKALPEPEHAGEGEGYEAPRTPEEEVVAGIWAEVLGVERVGVRDNFFALGGHSLLATVVAARTQRVFGVETRVGMLFEAPTVAELAARIDLERRAGEGAVLPPLAPVAREAPLPLSFAQERLWFLHQMEPEGAGYNMPWSGRLRGRLDAGALERALGGLVRRHEALRTTFRPVEQGAVQVVHPDAPARLPVLDLTGLAPQARDREARLLAREDAARPFDLERGPLLRATLACLSGEEHVLLLTMHHVVSDGWSMGVLFRELFTLYEALSRPSGAARPASPLPPLAVQYADFAVWQRGWLRGEVLRRQLDWWREQLGGAPPVLELPTDRPRPAVASSRGASHGFPLPADITRGLRSLARREGATLYMVTHAALDLLLSRWSGQEDLVVGSPIAGRTQVETEGLIGFFVNTLALRTDLSGDPSFQALLGRVRETALGAYAHQDLPFERLVEEVAPERGLSHTPLFQVMFALQNVRSGEGSAIAGLRLEPFGGEIRTVHFDLELDLREVGEGLAGSLRYRTDLFDAATIERFAAQYRVVLASAGASPEERLSRLAILPAEEADAVLAYGTGPARDGAADIPVHRLFAAQAARAPGAPAILFDGDALTYSALDEQATALALRLRDRGVDVGTTVAVCVDRGPRVLVALLAVWKAGGVYLPLETTYPAERLSFLLRDSDAGLVLTEFALAESLPEFGGEIIALDTPHPPAPSPTRGEGEHDTTQSEDRQRGDSPPPARGRVASLSEPGGGDLAYLIYTSGSTGTPKAVMVEHAQLAHTLLGAQDVLGFGAGDVVAALASVAFDISLLELVAPLLAGAAVRVAPRGLVRDPEALVDALADVTVLHAVPALMRQVVETARAGREMPALRILLVGGDSVPPDLLEDMRDVFPAAQTRVLYGPTEGTIICATYAVPAEGAVVGHPLGRPLPGVRLGVRGPRGETCPVGVPGEVWISGGGVTRGYLGRPELTAEKFVEADGERAYRTGDRARWRPDGVLEFLGRTDEQVKVRGFRIELGEVEAVLGRHPAVRGVAAVVRGGSSGSDDVRIVAYLEADAGVSVAEVREQARASLPEYMVPATFVVLDALPLTSTGKVDRRALPEPEPAAAPADEEPRTELERAIAAVWAEVLGVEAVGVRTSFFDLGGNSLLVVRAARLLESALGRSVRVMDFFEHVTVADLARHLSGAAASAPTGDAEHRGEELGAGNDGPGRLRRAIPVRPTGSERPLFLVHDGWGSVAYAQVLHQHLDEELPVYALPPASIEEPPLRTVEDMATRLVRMVREVQPVGPYRLAGWSFGGLLAYEMAAQLIGQDQAVEFLGMIDTYHPSLVGIGAGDTGHGESLPLRIVRGEDTGESDGMGPEDRASAASEADPGAFATQWREEGLLPGHLTGAESQEVQDRSRNYLLSLRGYSARPVPLPVHLFFARDDAGVDPRRGWQTLLDDASIHATPVPGTHYSMMEPPDVEALGRAMSCEVGRATASRKVPTMSADALMSTLDEAKPVHARWSEVNRQFLEFVATNPECLDRASYTVVSQAPGLQTYSSVQPWPLFFEPQRLRELAEMAVGMDGLIKAAVERFLQNDIRTIAGYYRSPPSMEGSPETSGMINERSIPTLVAEPNGVASAFSRGDYLETQEGFKVMEFNSSGFLGGLATDYLCERYLESTPTTRFLSQVNRRARPMGIRRAMLRHVVEDSERLGAWTEGDFNVAIVIYPNDPPVIAEFDAEAYTRELHAALVEAGHAPCGRVMLCSMEELSAGGNGVTLGGQPVHAVIEQQGGNVLPVFRAFKERRVNLFSGPIKWILSDKRNLALVSEHADSADFSAAERALIERHLAWTRRVLPSRTTFRGRPLRLPDDLPAGRDDFVLKKGWSNRGEGVVVGRFRTPDEWEQAIARAVREGDWVVQERLDPVPYCFHNARAGAVRHEVVWGLFVFGEYFGGVHLTMLPTGHGSGVVNPNQGAELGAGLALVD